MKYGENQKSILDGVMLGDGSIYYNTKTNHNSAQFELQQSEKHSLWVENVRDYMQFNTKLEKRSNLKYPAIRIRKKSKFFKEQHDRWYLTKEEFQDTFDYTTTDKNRKYIKIIPKNIRINEISLKHWYLGDGGVHNRKPKLFTYFFPLVQLKKIIIPKLDKYHLDPEIHFPNCMGEEGKFGHIIIINSITRFFKIINTPTLIGFDNKLEGDKNESNNVREEIKSKLPRC